jgi:ribose transport system permease protein
MGDLGITQDKPLSVSDDSAQPAYPAASGGQRWDLIMRLGLLGIIAILIAIFSVTASGFLTLQNLDNNARQMAVVGILAVGETFVIITAGIDLSVGSLLGFGGIIIALALAHNVPTVPAIAVVLAIGAVIGLVNGKLISAAALPPFIVTLGMLGILRGLTQILGNGQQVAYDTPSFTNFAAGTTLGVPNLFWVFALVCVVSGLFLHLTRRGRYMYAIGSNMESARRAGINTSATILTVYAISGLLAAIAGILLTARQAQGDPNAGTGYELDAIAAAVLGGASLFGARGSVLGTFLGVTLVQIMTNGLNLLNFDPQVARMLEGALIILFVYVDHWRKPKVAIA